VSAVQNQKAAFASRVSRLGLCETDLPSIAYNVFPPPADAQLVHNKTRDADCGDKAFFINYHSDRVGAAGEGWGDCVDRRGDRGRASLRCVSPTDSSPNVDVCAPSSSSPWPRGVTTKSFLRVNIIGCFCLQVRV
jgi:hypothetical protein